MPSAATHPNVTKSKRRALGQYYTPQRLAAYMVRECMVGITRHRSSSGPAAPRILDPACGDGAFVIEAFQQLLASNKGLTTARTESNATSPSSIDVADQLGILKNSIFGVDVDPSAISDLRQRLRSMISPPASYESRLTKILHSNFHVGDALLGPDFGTANDAANFSNFDSALNWTEAFPHIASEGGFDVILGNPPYRRELHARDVFDRIKKTSFGRRWCQARMDLWYFFVHRGLDLLRQDGALSFVVNSYWLKSAGAKLLIDRLQHETTMEEIVLLGSAPVFDSVQGKHLIFRLRKCHSKQRCRIVDFSSRAEAIDAFLRAARKEPKKNASGNQQDKPAKTHDCDLMSSLRQSELYANGHIIVRADDRFAKHASTLPQLQNSFHVRQGMAENPPVISSRHRNQSSEEFRIGEGVFVLTADEVDELRLSAQEQRLLRPYFQTSAIGRYDIPQSTDRYVLYMTKTTAPSLSHCASIERHLTRFRPILERRREVRQGSIGWWHLHWPRQESLFRQPRILSVQMGRRPQFVWAEHATFVGFSINIVQPIEQETLPLPALTAILNSSLAYRWFQVYAKHRGANLEINGRVLQRFPLPLRNHGIETRLSELVSRIQSILSDEFGKPPTEELAVAESEVEELVSKLYKFDPTHS